MLWLIEIEDDSNVEGGASDSWLGRALDMERRTRKIVGMAETNLEDSLESKVEAILQKIEAMSKKQDDLEYERSSYERERSERYSEHSVKA